MATLPYEGEALSFIRAAEASLEDVMSLCSAADRATAIRYRNYFSSLYFGVAMGMAIRHFDYTSVNGIHLVEKCADYICVEYYGIRRKGFVVTTPEYRANRRELIFGLTAAVDTYVSAERLWNHAEVETEKGVPAIFTKALADRVPGPAQARPEVPPDGADTFQLSIAFFVAVFDRLRPYCKNDAMARRIPTWNTHSAGWP
jgi:hypothetical protein